NLAISAAQRYPTTSPTRTLFRSRMLEEIREQPTALERTLKAELRRAERFKKFLERRRPRLVILAARGTSDNAALFGRYLLEITTDRKSTRLNSSHGSISYTCLIC